MKENRSVSRPFLLSLCAAIAFAYTAYTVSTADRLFLDVLVHNWMTIWGHAAGRAVMQVVSYLGSTELLFILTAVTLLALWLNNRRAQAWLLFFVMGGGVVLNALLKFIIQRGRPGDAVHVFELFGADLQIISYSFPSGHAMRAFLFYGFMMYLTLTWVRRRAGKHILLWLFVTVITLIGMSRIVLDAHFASDIIAAYTVSFAWLHLCIALFRLRLNKRTARHIGPRSSR